MKIREVRCAGLRGRTPEGGWSHELRPDDCVHTLVAVITECGQVGVGSSFTSDSLVRASLEQLRPLLLGETALEPERVSEKLHQNTFWLGRGGAITHAISGIDIALWDLLGKAVGQPIGRLLGGRYRNRVQPYASVLMDEPCRLRDKLQAVKASGFTAFKIGWGPFGRKNHSLDRAIVDAARDAVGTECRLLVDAGGSDAFWPNGLSWAIRTANMLADFDVEWFEEPISPDALEDHVALRKVSPVPIAGGEVLTRRQSFQPWFVNRAIDIVQPDVTKVGGISEERRVASMAQEFGVKFIPHGWNTAVGLAADLQLVSAFSCSDMVEYLTGSPFIDELVEPAWQLDETGLIAIPEGPGLGICLREDAIEEFSGVRRFLSP
ncbi:MAG: mandelate racemase/muconate lactonizing enzyme family protein [Planctomycetaceae bacterium]|nr:mandelate racemase/muconate lactonizing enzyme family protein [Planctomycetaceae bacterium]